MTSEEKSATQILDASKAAIEAAIVNPNVPKLYFNGFSIGMTNSDVVILAQLNAQSAAVLNMSFEIAKSLVVKLTPLVEQVEQQSGFTFATTDDLSIQKLSGKQE